MTFNGRLESIKAKQLQLREELDRIEAESAVLMQKAKAMTKCGTLEQMIEFVKRKTRDQELVKAEIDKRLGVLEESVNYEYSRIFSTK